MEQIVFQVPQICEYLTEETKLKTYLYTEKDQQNSKITSFFDSMDSMYDEIRWQSQLQQNFPVLSRPKIKFITTFFKAKKLYFSSQDRIHAS